MTDDAGATINTHGLPETPGIVDVLVSWLLGGAVPAPGGLDRPKRRVPAR